MTGFTVKPGDPIDLADRIELLMNDATLQREMGNRAADRVREQFTDERFVDELAALIAQVACGRARLGQPDVTR